MSLLGNLNEVKLADVFRLFSSSKKTGRLTVSGDGAQAVLRFQKGSIVFASCGRLQGEDAVVDVFGWGDGELTFIPEETRVEPNVTRGIEDLILDGLRLGPTAHRMRSVIPTDRVAFQMASPPNDGSITVGALEWRVVRVLDGVRDIREVVEATKVPRGDVVRVLFELMEAGFLEKVEPQKTLKIVAQGLFGKDSAELDTEIDVEWRRLVRFAGGIPRVEVKGGGSSLVLPASFRIGLGREVHLPRSAVSELGLKEGDEVGVRPAS
jgi:hypothetical protein